MFLLVLFLFRAGGPNVGEALEGKKITKHEHLGARST